MFSLISRSSSSPLPSGRLISSRTRDTPVSYTHLKLLTVLGIVVILASIIANIQFIFRATSLYVYLIMLILIFGGAALVGQVLFRWPKDEDEKKKK